MKRICNRLFVMDLSGTLLIGSFHGFAFAMENRHYSSLES